MKVKFWAERTCSPPGSRRQPASRRRHVRRWWPASQNVKMSAEVPPPLGPHVKRARDHCPLAELRSRVPARSRTCQTSLRSMLMHQLQNVNLHARRVHGHAGGTAAHSGEGEAGHAAYDERQREGNPREEARGGAVPAPERHSHLSVRHCRYGRIDSAPICDTQSGTKSGSIYGEDLDAATPDKAVVSTAGVFRANGWFRT